MSQTTNMFSRRARHRLKAGDYDSSLLEFELAIATSDSDLSPYFGAAYIYEEGSSSAGIQLEKALMYYGKVYAVDTKIGGVASLAMARVMFKSNDKSHVKRAAELCRESLRIKETAQAHMLLGVIRERWMHDPEAAEAEFLQAYRLNSVWGLRLYAASLWRRGRYASSILAHIRATLIAPALYFRETDQSIFG